jgi:hypothetical protein
LAGWTWCVLDGGGVGWGDLGSLFSVGGEVVRGAWVRGMSVGISIFGFLDWLSLTVNNIERLYGVHGSIQVFFLISISQRLLDVHVVFELIVGFLGLRLLVKLS